MDARRVPCRTRVSVGLGAGALRSASWAYGSYVGGRVLVLASTAILARLLGPEEFGLVALALVFTSLVETVKDLGVTQALIVDQGDGEGRASTAYAFGLGAALVLWGVTAALGPVAAAAFDEDQLAVLLAVLGLNFPLRALGATHFALAQKRMDFRTRAAAELSDVIVRGATGVGLALAGAGAYSLVGGYLAGTVVLTLVVRRRVDFRPARREVRREHFSSLVRFGGTLTAVDVVAAFNNQVDYLITGRVLGTEALGLYTIAFRLPELLIRNLAVVAGQVLFPAFATIGRGELAGAFVRALRLTVAVAAPMAVALAVLAEPLVLTLFGEQWREAVDPMRALAIFALIGALNIPAGTAYKATGRAGVLLWLSAPRGVALVVALVVFVDDGLVAVALCQLATSAVSALVGVILAARLLHVALGRVVAAVAGPVAAALVTGIALAGVAAVLDGLAALVAAAVVGLPLYLGAMALVAPDVMATARGAAPGRRAAPEPDRAG